MEMQKFDIAIVGAGPAGCSAALSLQNSDCSVALFDKMQFPRTKICGDGICDRSINTLRAISENYCNEWLATKKMLSIPNTQLVYNGRPYTIELKNFGYTCKRVDFDSFLFSLVQRDCKNVSLYQQQEIRDVSRSDGGILLQAADGTEYWTKMLLVCNGASSKIARTLTNKSFDKSKMGVAIRAYYTGVEGLGSAIELHYRKDFFPGYLWIFPMADGSANVGFGCRFVENSLGDENIRAVFENWLQEDEQLQKRFAHAERVSAIQGGLVPYSTAQFECFGDNYCICGDAANLIDPISGGGIGSAMLSGRLAALQADKCVKQSDCSQSATKEYAELLKKRVEKEMRTRYSIQKMVTKHTWLLDVLAFVGRREKLLRKITNWYL